MKNNNDCIVFEYVLCTEILNKHAIYWNFSIDINLNKIMKFMNISIDDLNNIVMTND